MPSDYNASSAVIAALIAHNQVLLLSLNGLPLRRHWIHLAVAAGTGLAACVAGAEPCANTVAAAPAQTTTLTDRLAPISVSAAGAEITASGQTTLTGPVTVTQGRRTLTATQATYADDTQSFKATGSVDYHDPIIHLAGDVGSWNADGSGQFLNGTFDLLSRQGHGRAGDMLLDPSGKLTLTHVDYTSCPMQKPDWMLHANRIVINQKTQEGFARNVHLDIEGIPFLYLPALSFPIGDARRSGFLFPILGQTTNSGFQVAAPYYWDIAPNYDATVTPGFFSSRGASLGSEFRFLSDNSRGSIKTDWVPNDAVSHSDRFNILLTERTDLSPRLRLDTDIHYVSDSAYFQNFGGAADATSVTYLQRAASLTYLDSHWKIIGLVDQFQTIDQAIAPTDRPYARAPEIDVHGHWNEGLGFGFDLRAQGVDFVRPVGTEGLRYRIDPTLSYTWQSPAAFITPTVGYQSLQYQLKNTGLAPDHPSVNAPIATLDAGLSFERETSHWLQTLEPRLLYSYVPYRQQNDLPVFDTGTPDLTYTQLYNANRYVGGDRIADENQLAAGATSRWLDPRSGKQLLSATLGQIYYFTPPRISLPGEPAASAANSSDVVGQVELTAYQNWNLSVGEVWNPHDKQGDLSEVRVRYQPENNQVINLGYRFRRDLLEQLEASFAWPLAHGWNVFARELYSLKDHASVDALGGFEYQACCFKVKLLARHYVSTFTGTRDTSITLQVELNGLSNGSDRTGAFLQQAIRGYSPVNSTTGAP